MLLTKEVFIKWNPKNKIYYESKGYKFTKCKDEFIVKVEDLSEGSKAIVEVLCDYCNEKIIPKLYYTYIKQNKDSIVHKDCCNSCRPLKLKESNLLIYGVESTSSLNLTKEKVKKKNREKFGTEYYSQTNEFKSRRKVTCLEKYGVENYTQTEEYKQKTIITNMKNLGVQYPTQSQIVKEKIKNTVKRKYGEQYDNVIQVPEIAKKSRENANKTMFKNGTQSASRQQKYIHNIIGGELNFLVDNIWLDIAFPNDKIYVEFQGSGHRLDLKLGKVTEKQFNMKELKRYMFLKSKGWKMIEIISTNDLLPKENILKELINLSIKKLQETNNWIKIDLDNKIIKLKNEIITDFPFGSLFNLKRNEII